MMLALAAACVGFAQAPAPREIHFELPPGFTVDRPSDLQGSLLSLAFGPDGSAYVGRESAGVLRLSDRDHDGQYERVVDIAPELQSCQGLLVFRGSLWAVGLRNGKSGLWRLPMDGNQIPASDIEQVFEFTDGGEHGPHGIVASADGSVYVTVGNQATFGDAPEHLGSFWKGDEGRLLAPYADPLGYGTQVRYPGGFVARVDLFARTWQYVAVGLRNAYDLAIDGGGGVVAVDSDMEWDLGLPWYRPVRLLRILEGADYGSRAGSSVIPEWCIDTEPARLELGRGSPTGAVYGTHSHFPDMWYRALFVGDWSQGKIFAIDHNSKAREFLSCDSALPVTDLDVGPEGGLWFLTGGRGTQGGVFRVSYAPRSSGSPWGPDQVEGETPGARLERAARRLIAGKPFDPPFEIGSAFAKFDRELWPLELRIVGALATETELDSLSRSSSIEQRIGALVVLSSGHSVGSRTNKIVTSGLALLDALKQSQDPRKELTLAVLRALELALLRQGDPSPELATQMGTRLIAMFPHEDARIAGEIGVLLSHLDDERALVPLLAEMQESSQELAIHYCDCVHRMTRGWSLERRTQMLDWFARSRAYKGGVSLPGYLSAMRAHFVAKLPAEACEELAQL
ncbi:MAG TPA: hypothetical protein VM509_00295, partial [Planctomycetota bacterium]|nr:hypothetical protein [Planctomycetota bacterium]